MSSLSPPTKKAVDTDAATLEFIQRWEGVTASELSTAQSFFIELCTLLAVAPPHPTHEQDYMFERPLTFQHGDGSTSPGRVDCYKRGHFVWESKKLKQGVSQKATGKTTKAFDDALLRARQQAEDYARALPAAEGRPPFVAVLDVGHVIELYAEFTRSGATYVPFPDPRSHRITLKQLVNPAIRARLRALWVDPMSLDPTRVSAKVTRKVAAELAYLAKSLEVDGHAPQQVAAFLTRSLFSMFAEDVGLLPTSGPEGVGSFVHLLKTYREQPDVLTKMLRVFWAGMDQGGFNAAIAKNVLRFNGKLFKGAESDGYALPLSISQIDGLLRAAMANWQEVEPAIFGTLLERALDSKERHALGAHYTPRSYVERLVLPAVVEPLRFSWVNVQAAAVLLAREADDLEGKKRDAKLEEARAVVRQFLHRLCTLRVLDPACGSGNFLYVTLEHLKRLEGEVLNQLEALGDTQNRLGLEGETVTLQQLRGIELNERAAALAELVLWIGWLQWHVRTKGLTAVAEPVVHDYGNIEHRDAVLTYSKTEPVFDAKGAQVMRWDGETMKKHLVTGKDVPDENALVPLLKYVNPRPVEWPQADYIVGNPPFIGNKRMRTLLGDGYADAVRSVWPAVPESADFVMYWWNKAAETVRNGAAERFGFITTNSLTMIFNRQVIEAHQSAMPPLSLVFAVPNHPWVDSTDGAAVRIAMSVGVRGDVEGEVHSVVAEEEHESGEVAVALLARRGKVHPDLKVGANLTKCAKLKANMGLPYMGMIPLGAGFWIDREKAIALGLGTVPGFEKHVRRYRNGRDLTGTSRGVLALDFYGLSETELRSRFPAAYQWLLDEVKPKRDHDKRPSRRRNWWLWGESVPKFRNAVQGLSRYIGTTETAKHRTFVFIESDVLPDQKIRSVASDDALLLGVLSSRVHVTWAIATGGWLGVGDDPVYNTTKCFEPFPFPSDDTGLTSALANRIRELAEQLDTHRKARQAAHAEVTLTGMYNVLEKLRSGEALTAKDKVLNELGLVGVLKTLHDDLDEAVLKAYGWPDLNLAVDTDALLERLVVLNLHRAAEEANGNVRWLRPSFQDPAQPEMDVSATPKSRVDEATEDDLEQVARVQTVAIAALPWPASLPEQVRSVADLLAASPAPLALVAIERAFKGKGPWKRGLPRILDTLEAVGRARQVEGGWRG